MENGVLNNIFFKLLRVGAGSKLEIILKRAPTEEIKQFLSHLDIQQKNRLVHLLFSKKIASRTIRDFTSEIFKELTEAIQPSVWVELISQLQPDDAARLLSKLESVYVDSVLSKIDPSLKVQLVKLLGYEEGTAGSLMNPNFFALPETATINEAIDMVRKQTQVEMVFYLYVVDAEKHLTGIVSLRRLIMTPGEAALKDIMDPNVVSVHIFQSQSEVAQTISRYNFLAIPVVDDDKHLQGVVTVDDVIDVIQKEASEDIYRLAGLEKDERVFSPVKQSIRRRAPWLVINLATAILAASVVGFFEGTLQKLVLLATFLPVVAGMGGNAATQTLTITIRGLSLGELVIADVWKAVKRQITIGVANGIITGTIMAVVAYLWKGIPMLGIVLMLAMIGNLFVSAVAGVVVPIGLKALKIDPAIASTVIVTTFTDCFGFFSFLGLSTLLLHYLL